MLDFLRFQNMKPSLDVKALPKVEVVDFEKYEYGVKMGIFNATSVQVDGGDYGSRTKFHHHLDMGFGSIDKTDVYKGHRERRSLYDDRWKWEERLGVRKIERTTRYAATSIIEQLHQYTTQFTDIYRAGIEFCDKYLATQFCVETKRLVEEQSLNTKLSCLSIF